MPIGAVGLYVPAGSAPLPSTAIMLAVPAAIAGCPQRVLCTPPKRDGAADPAVLVAARKAGVERVFKVGGAQAIAAMAYGTAHHSEVRQALRPGNAWVTAAKHAGRRRSRRRRRRPAGRPRPRCWSSPMTLPAADFVAADLLAQAEHSPDAQALLVTTSAELARRGGRADRSGSAMP